MTEDVCRFCGWNRRAEGPAAPEGYIDWQQRRGAFADIVAEAMATYDGWMADDDYDALGVLDRIIGRMRERYALYSAAPEGEARAIWTCPSCGWRQPADRPRICGRNGEPCNGDRPAAPPQEEIVERLRAASGVASTASHAELINLCNQAAALITALTEESERRWHEEDAALQAAVRGRQAAEARALALQTAAKAIIDFCDDPSGSEKDESLALGLSRLLPDLRAASALVGDIP